MQSAVRIQVVDLLHSLARFVALLLACVLIVADVTYIVLGVVPFYANGIAWQPHDLVAAQTFDPSGYAPYSWEPPTYPFYRLALASSYFVALAGPALALAQAGCLASLWNRTSRPARKVYLAVVLISLALALSVWTLHRIIVVWLID